MDQARFQIGIPKAGSAARSAEHQPRVRGLASLAGSAARAAEEERRTAEPSGFKGSPTISIRASGGKVFQLAAGGGAVAVSAPVPSSPAAVDVPAAAKAVSSVSQSSAMTQADESSQPGALQTAVSRVHSLVRSLFGGQARTH